MEYLGWGVIRSDSKLLTKSFRPSMLFWGVQLEGLNHSLLFGHRWLFAANQLEVDLSQLRDSHQQTLASTHYFFGGIFVFAITFWVNLRWVVAQLQPRLECQVYSQLHIPGMVLQCSLDNQHLPHSHLKKYIFPTKPGGPEGWVWWPGNDSIFITDGFGHKPFRLWTFVGVPREDRTCARSQCNSLNVCWRCLSNCATQHLKMQVLTLASWTACAFVVCFHANHH